MPENGKAAPPAPDEDQFTATMRIHQRPGDGTEWKIYLSVAGAVIAEASVQAQDERSAMQAVHLLSRAIEKTKSRIIRPQ